MGSWIGSEVQRRNLVCDGDLGVVSELVVVRAVGSTSLSVESVWSERWRNSGDSTMEGVSSSGSCAPTEWRACGVEFVLNNVGGCAQASLCSSGPSPCCSALCSLLWRLTYLNCIDFLALRLNVFC